VTCDSVSACSFPAPSAASDLATVLRAGLRAGMTVAVGDGVGQVQTLDDGTSVWAALSAAARDVGPLRLVLGWLPVPPVGLDRRIAEPGYRVAM
jgi:hypothetical protein